MLSSDLDLLSHSHVECFQFIGPVSANRDARCSIAKSVLIAGQLLFISSYWWSLLTPLSPELLMYILFLHSLSSPQFSHPSILFPFCQVNFYFCLLFPFSPTSASSCRGSGERGSQSRENTCVGVCVSRWKPPIHSPLDKGRFFATSVKEAHCHIGKVSHFSSRTCSKDFLLFVAFVLHWMHRMGPCYKHAFDVAFLSSTCLSLCQNGEVLSTTWEEDVVLQKSSSILNLKITPADNQAVLCCESVNLVSLLPKSVSRKITVLCKWKKCLI